MKTINDFYGSFATQLRMFLKEKRALGFKYQEEERVLHIFDDFSESFDCSNGLSRELVLSFTEKQPQWSHGTHGHCISIIRQFARFLKRHGIAAYMCEPQRESITYDKFKPYIFTKNQIAQLFEQADNIEPSKSSPLMHVFYPVLFRVLYGFGLRISEALKLRVKNVDLTEGVLYILNPKNHRDRIVPMEASLMRYVTYYAKIANTLAGDKDYFFRTRKGGMFSHRGIYTRFRMLLWQCGISHGGRSHGPRIHDLRYPNLNKIRTFRKEPDIQRKIRGKGSDNNYFFIVRTPQYADKFPSVLRHFLGADLSFSSSSVANAFASCSVVMSR